MVEEKRTPRKSRKTLVKGRKPPKVKKKRGRKIGSTDSYIRGNSTYSDEMSDAIANIFRIDGTLKEACEAVGITAPTYYRWEKTIHGFKEKMDQAKNEPYLLAKKTLMNSMLNADDDATKLRAAIEFLKRRDKNYSDKVQNTNVNFDIKELSQEEKDKVNLLLQQNYNKEVHVVDGPKLENNSSNNDVEEIKNINKKEEVEAEIISEK